MPDAITMLREDHRAVKQLFQKFERAGESTEQKRQLVDEMIRELSVHAAVEEQVFYPAVRQAVPDAEDTVLEGLEEHHIVKWTLSELEDMEPTDERYDAKVSVLMESVRHHIDEEESEMFPKVRDALGRKALQELGETIEMAKRAAPTRPHPRTPDTPPGNLATGVTSGVLDKVRDIVSRNAKPTQQPTQRSPQRSPRKATGKPASRTR